MKLFIENRTEYIFFAHAQKGPFLGGEDGGGVLGNEATFGTSAKMKTSTLSKAPPTADPKCQHQDCYKRAACHVKDTPPP